MGREHKQELLTVCKPEWGSLLHVQSTFDNRALLFYYILEKKTLFQRLVFQDKIVDESFGNHTESSLSFDGKELALARVVEGPPSDSWHCEISINGDIFWRTEPFFKIDHLNWLSNEHLAWDGWFEDNEGRPTQDKGIGYFVNRHYLTP